MKYFLLCALVIAGAFFSPVYADQTRCPDGGTFTNHPQLGDICSGAPSFGLEYVASLFGKTGRGKSPSAAGNDLAGKLSSSEDVPLCPNKTTYTFTGVHSSNQYLNFSVYIEQYQKTPGCPSVPGYPLTTTTQSNLAAFPDVYSCPSDERPQLQNSYGSGSSMICYILAISEPECDCANFAGQSLNTRNTLRAPKGQYTNENPPQCVMQQEFVAGRDTPLTCTCQVSAQKWMKTNSGFENGVEYERWETLPTTQGQPSGTFTGVKCGSTDGGPLEPENNAPKECFTLPNGVRWCWADKAEKCQVVNGVEQCASGCGTVNGDFVCYDDKPVIPPKDRDNLTPPDDTLTDPSKSINDMVKSDFKEVNKGVETRLDNVVTSISNTTIAMDEVSDKVGLTNSKLDGIGMQLDGVGKQLGAIDGKLEGAFGDKGQPMPGTGDGKNCHEEVCSWYESAYPDGLVGIWEERSLALQQTALFDFVNQFSFEPSGSQPEMQLCFNLASYANFGCFSLEIPAFVWVFLRVCILFSAAMLCRALIFGG